MWPLDKPEIDAATALDASKSLIRNIAGRRTRINAARNHIIELMDNYEARALDTELHLIDAHEITAGTITKDEMKLLYESGLRRVGAARHIYDALMALAPNKRCPYCGHRRVKQLDHFLPQAKYPAFSVTPFNLVPACSDCNKDKLDGDADTLSNIPLHPYFENIDTVCWLKAEVIIGPIAVFKYLVDEECGLDPSDLERLINQYDKLNLAELYSIEANDQLACIRLTLRNQYEINGAGSVRQYLWGEHTSAQSYRRNAWQTAFYEAAQKSDWFCEGGFNDPDLP